MLDAPGRQSLTFEMVGPQELPNAVALNSGLVNASRIVGPAIAGVIIAVAGRRALLRRQHDQLPRRARGALAMRRTSCTRSPPIARVTLLKGTREGLAFAWHDRQVRVVLVVMTCVGLVGFNFNTLVPLLASDTLHVDARAFGLLSAAFGLGAFCGAIATASFKRATFRAFVLGTAGFSTLLIALAPVHQAWLAGVLLVGVGASFTLFAANANALVQLAAPDHLRGPARRAVPLRLRRPRAPRLAPLGRARRDRRDRARLPRQRLRRPRRHRLRGRRGSRLPAPPRTRERRLTAPAPIPSVPADATEEVLDDDLREPRFQLRQQHSRGRTLPHSHQAPPRRRSRRGRSVPRTTVA